MILYEMPDGIQSRWASFENPGAKKGEGGAANQGAKGAPYQTFAPGESKVLLDVEGSGTVRRIWMTLENPDARTLRSLRLDMYWDHAATPAVSVPVGDFFGAPLGQMTRFENELFANPEGRSFNCYIPMPFRTAARIVITNESDDIHQRLFYDVDFTLGEKHSKDTLYFHASWRRENPTRLGTDFTILPTISGRGRFLGAHLGVLATPGLLGWWGEGEAKIFLDGDAALATLVGTGTEDYIGTGWGQGVYAGRYQGSLVVDNDRGRYAFYRYHLPEPVYFYHDCRVTLQQMGGADRNEVLSMLAAGMPIQPVSVIGNDGEQCNLLDGSASTDLNNPAYDDTWVNYYRVDDVSALALFYLNTPEAAGETLAPLADRVAGRWTQPIPDKTVVLTFDDAVKSHLTFVAPLLKELGFGATFFITQSWMSDTVNFLSWEDVAELYRMGFEIGNHTWTHLGLSDPEKAKTLPDELAQVDKALAAVGVPRPVSFAWPGNGFGPEALAVLREKGYQYARRGMQPEQPYGEVRLGPLFDPKQHDPLLIPTAGDAYPSWTLDHFKQVVDRAKDGRIAVVQFHGVPDVAHPWVHTPPERFREYMDYLQQQGFHVIALRDLGRYRDPDSLPDDPMAKNRYPQK